LNIKLYLTVLIVFSSCVERFEIPKIINSESSYLFGAGDTTYLELKPVWDETYGLEDPSEISVAPDGRIFVSDRLGNSIHVFNQDGSRAQGFEPLRNLTNQNGESLYPIDVDIDGKMNVFFIDGSEIIYVWNQYWNEVGISKVSSSILFNHVETDVDTIVDFDSDVWYSMINSDDWQIKEINFMNDQNLIQELLDPHVFYDGKEDINLFNDAFYKPDSSRFKGITSNSNQDNIFVADDFGGLNNQHRIIQIDFKRRLLIELNSNDTVWVYKGEFGSSIKGFGTGSGTVNKPSSLDIDYQGNLYYTQKGEFFPVHMIIPNYSGDFATFNSGFEPGVNDIMDASQYGEVVDISVDNDKNVYIVDIEQKEVTIFNSKGNFFKNIQYTVGGDSSFIMNAPVAITVDDRGILYVCDEADKSIYRFKLSNNLDEDIIIED